MRAVLVVGSLIFASHFSPCFAGPVGPGGSMTFEQIRNGTMLFPAAICPSVNKRYEDMTDKLESLRTQIRKTANCKDEEVKVEDFSSVVANNRNKLWALIEKGRKAPLTDSEAKEVKGYVESLTKTGGALTDVIAGSSCFNDDKRNQLSTEVVASLISESANALATVSGPYGPIVGLGGQLAGTLITSIDKVVRSRRAYDFSDADQRKLFVKTMCTYHGFKSDIDEISRLDESMRIMREYQKALVGQISAMTTACTECASIMKEYQADFLKDAPYVRSSMPDLIKKFHERVSEADSRFELPIGTSTVIAIRSFVWSVDELKRHNESLSDLGDVERDRVMAVQNTIEDFLFAKWLPEFLNHYQDELSNRFIALTRTAELRMKTLGLDPYDWKRVAPYGMSAWGGANFPPLKPTADLVEAVFAADPQGRVSVMAAARADIDREISAIASAVMVIEKSCQFARAGKLAYAEKLYRICEVESSAQLKRVYDLFYKLLVSSHKDSAVLKTIFEIPGPVLIAWAEANNQKLPNTGYIWTSSWIESLTLLIGQLNAYDPEVYKPKAKPPSIE